MVTVPATRDMEEQALSVTAESERAFDFGDRHKCARVGTVMHFLYGPPIRHVLFLYGPLIRHMHFLARGRRIRHMQTRMRHVTGGAGITARGRLRRTRSSRRSQA